MLTVRLSDNPADFRRFETAAEILANVMAGVVAVGIETSSYPMIAQPEMICEIRQ